MARKVTVEVTVKVDVAATRNNYIHNSWYRLNQGVETVQFDDLEPVGSPARKRVIKPVDLLNHAHRVRGRARELYQIADKTMRGGPSPLLGVVPNPEPQKTPQE